MTPRLLVAIVRPAVALALASGLGLPAQAQAGTIELVAVRPLDFGAMVVFGSGTKQITADGQVTVTGLATLRGAREGPAQFTLRYRPDTRPQVAVIALSITTVGQVSNGGTTGTLGTLVTDLPGMAMIGLGDSSTIRLPLCNAAVCQTTFRVGGILSLTGGANATAFSFPLQVTVRLVAEVPG